MRGRKTPFRHVKCVRVCVGMSCHHQDNTGVVVWCQWRLSPSLFPQIHYLGNGKSRKITDQRRTNSLTSSSCLSTFRTSCVFSSEREKKNSNILISRQKNSASWQQPNSPATGEEERKKDREKNNTRGHIWRYIYTFSLHDEPTFDVS